MNYTITYEWIDNNEVDLDELYAVLATFYGCEIDAVDDYYNEEAGGWVVTGDDNNSNNIPDFIDSLVADPTVTNKSQGGAFG